MYCNRQAILTESAICQGILIFPSISPRDGNITLRQIQMDDSAKKNGLYKRYTIILLKTCIWPSPGILRPA